MDLTKLSDHEIKMMMINFVAAMFKINLLRPKDSPIIVPPGYNEYYVEYKSRGLVL